MIEEISLGVYDPEAERENETVTETEEETETVREEGLNLNGYEDEHGVDIMNSGMDTLSSGTGNILGSSRSSGSQVRTSEYIFPEVNSRYLSRSEVEALSLQAICYAKNEIYARHGRKFRSKELQEYFGSKSWYNGFVDPDDFADWVFNDYERVNLDLIVSCELAIRPDGYQLDQPGYNIYAVNTASRNDVSAGGESIRSADNTSGSEYLNRDYIFSDSDSRYLTEAEVNALTKTEAGYAYKEILARRGCIFKTEQYQNYFQGKSWYEGRIREEDFTADLLNKYELANMELIKKLKAQ